MQILFISRYDRIRSRLAEAIFRKHNTRRDVQTASAGIIVGERTPRVVVDVAKRAKLHMKGDQTCLSTKLLQEQDFVVLVGDDIPVTLFTEDNPFVRESVVWKIPPVDTSTKKSIQESIRVITKNVKVLIEALEESPKELSTIQKILKDLKSLSDPSSKHLWVTLGVTAQDFFGVGITDIKDYAEEVKANKLIARTKSERHTLALNLWKTNIHDARLLATMIEEPSEVTEHQVETWLRQADFWDITDKIATEIIVHTSFGPGKIKPWIRERNDNIRRTGWLLLHEYARKGDVLTDKDFAYYLGAIESTINRESNWVREAMNYALIAIGKRNELLNARALDIAKRIGRVYIDYGGASCETPYAYDRLKVMRFSA